MKKKLIVFTTIFVLAVIVGSVYAFSFLSKHKTAISDTKESVETISPEEVYIDFEALVKEKFPEDIEDVEDLSETSTENQVTNGKTFSICGIELTYPEDSTLYKAGKLISEKMNSIHEDVEVEGRKESVCIGAHMNELKDLELGEDVFHLLLENEVFIHFTYTFVVNLATGAVTVLDPIGYPPTDL